jgi:3-isopropylmalate dehydrogenase
MASHNIVVFGGDHCGPEVTAEGVKILKVIEKEKSGISFNIQEHLLGGVCVRRSSYHSDANILQCSIDAHGTPLTDDALNAAKNADAILLGAIGGPVRLYLSLRDN